MGNVYEDKAAKYASSMSRPAAAYARKGLESPTSEEILVRILERGIKAASRLSVVLVKGVVSSENLKQIQLDMNAIDAADAVVAGENIPYVSEWRTVKADPEPEPPKKPFLCRIKQFFFPDEDVWADDKKLLVK